MKQKIVNFLKYNKTAYAVYYRVMSFCVNVLKLFVKTDDKLILFNSFAGRKYDDSPRAVFEAMKKDLRFKDYRLVWAFHQPERFQVDGAEKIKTDGLLYFKTALAARVWVTNSSVERGLNFKGRKTFYLNTWHGSPIKMMGTDIAVNNTSFHTKNSFGNVVDILNTQSYFEADIFSRCFGIPRNQILEAGLPRNDELTNYKEEYRIKLKKKLRIPTDKKIILYCPTFREYEKDDNLGVVLAPPIDLKKWRELLGYQYCLLFRAHYEISRVMDIEENEFVRNVTDYPILNHLMIVSDILISDYSSIFFDYSIMDKIMLHFTYDFDKYQEQRGMYFDIRDNISGGSNEDEMIKILKELDIEDNINKTRKFRSKYMNFYGTASKQTLDCIAEHIMLGE